MTSADPAVPPRVLLAEQRRLVPIGKIRIGQQVPTGTAGRTRPAKLDTFRFTSCSQALIGRVAGLYGGEPRPWTPLNGGPEQWEVISGVDRVPILVPPQQAVVVAFELWSGGGRERHCDGVTEALSNGPCRCDPDPERRDCKPTTRLTVLLRDVPGLGGWGLTSRGWNAAVELPGIAELLAAVRGYIPADLRLEQRVSRKDGQTRHFAVPVIEADISPGALMAGQGAVPPPPLDPAPDLSRRALLAPLTTTAPVTLDLDSVHAAIDVAATVEDLRGLWAEAREAGVLTPGLEARLRDRATALSAAHPAAPPGAEVDELWMQILSTTRAEWSTQDVEDDFQRVTGADPAHATAEVMRTYLADLRTRLEAS